jgi:hypothetical protein
VAVEHYRPKGKMTISEREERTLRYWLAGDWSNLLPSRTDCNSPRRHPVGTGPPQLLGNGNLLPISDERKRATKPGEEAREHRLLLHPYLDDPDEHLEFIDEGVVRPRRQKIRPSRMGAASIRVYGLQRPLLVEEQAAEQRPLLKQIAPVKREAKRWEQDPSDAEQEAILHEEVEALKVIVAPEHRYAGMARQTLNAHSTELASVGIVLGDV